MISSINQQIVISGVGGQGVLFVTRLLAEAAIGKGLPVFTSETHGMAQRGGTVLSHLKIGNFSSPLISPLKADGMLALKSENMAQHEGYLKPGSWAAVNCQSDANGDSSDNRFWLDADSLAQKIENTKSVNLIMLGFALAVSSDHEDGKKNLFCNIKEIITVIRVGLADKKMMLDSSIKALEAGYSAGISNM
jgi:indolepyruvate ferredoxin oxidoreductase, beta subunit